MNIVIFGATGPTGRNILQQALATHPTLILTAVARNPAAIEIQNERLRVVLGDVYDAQSVEQAIAGQDAVIAVFGSAYTPTKIVTIYSAGIRNILTAMQKQGVRRLLAVTSGGTNPHYDRNAGFIFSVIIKSIIGRTLYDDMRRMEAAITQSNLDWTIVRPARLIDTPGINSYRLGETYTLPHGTQTSRADLADFLLQDVQKNQYIHKAVAIA